MAVVPFQGNSLVADTSSLIYLTKASLIRPFLRAFHVTVPPLVCRESITEGYPGSDEIRGLIREGWLCVHPVQEGSNLHLGLTKRGERETIILFYQLDPDGILIDDSHGVKACRCLGIPFVSALLIPSLLLMKESIDSREAEEALEKIVAVGRYSERVVCRARSTLFEVCHHKRDTERIENMETDWLT